MLFRFHRVLITLTTVSSGFNVQAQERAIMFQNIFSEKKMTLHEGDEVHLKFTVHDTSDMPLDVAISEVTLFGKIEKIEDSSFTLVSKNKMFDRVSVDIRLNSIDAFRKYSRSRPVMKVATTIATGALGILVSMQIASSDQVFSWQNAGLAVSTTSAAYLSRQMFSDKMKYFTSEGWRGSIVTLNEKSNQLVSASGN